jgi:hypothetical protein
LVPLGKGHPDKAETMLYHLYNTMQSLKGDLDKLGQDLDRVKAEKVQVQVVEKVVEKVKTVVEKVAGKKRRKKVLPSFDGILDLFINRVIATSQEKGLREATDQVFAFTCDCFTVLFNATIKTSDPIALLRMADSSGIRIATDLGSKAVANSIEKALESLMKNKL